MKKVLMSGSTGFVGQNLSKYLLGEGFEIVSVSRSKSDRSSLDQISWVDIGQVQNRGVGAYLHLAGKAHDLKKTSAAEEYFTVNVGLTKLLFEEFLKSDAKDFIYFSSVKAAADVVDGVLDENIDPRPQTPYGKSKLEAEKYLLSQQLPAGKRVFILRPCMIHGPGNKGNLNLLYKLIKKGIPYPLAAFENRRSFIYIENLSFLIRNLLEQPHIPSGIYNLADDDTLSTVEVVETLSNALGKKPKLLFIPKGVIKLLARIGDFAKLPLNSERLQKLTESYQVSNTKIKNAIGVSNLPHTVTEGLQITTKSFEK